MFRNFLSRAVLTSLLITLIGGFVAFSQAQDLDTRLPIDPKVTTGVLDNGLKYYIRPNAKPEDKVELRLVVNAGSILEDDDQQGLAHFMEHMNFNGTKNFPKNELVSFLQSIGVKFGADLNAYTSFDETVYILPIPTDKAGNLEKGFQVLEDWAHQALNTDEEIDAERGIVLEESRIGKGADDRMLQKYIHDYLAGSKYADRLPIGKDDILKNFDYDAVRRFYRDWYRPDLMAVIAVGDITVDKARQMIEKHFSGIKNPTTPRERQTFEVKPYDTKKAVVVTDKEASSYRFSLIYSAQKEQKQTTVGDYGKQIVRQLFTSMLNKRFDELRQTANPPFTAAYGYIGGFARHYENFQLIVIPSTNIDQAVTAAVGELVKIQQYGFSASELEIAKKSVLNSMEKAFNERNNSSSSQFAAEYIRAFLTHEPIPGIENEYKYYQQIVPSVSLEQVNKVANSWLSQNDNYFALLTGNGKDLKVPTDMELLNTVEKAFQQEVTANEEKTIAQSLLDKMPEPGKIVSETKDKDLGATTYTLSNGVKVTIKTTDFKSDEIVFSGIKKGGTNSYSPADKQNVQLGIAGGMGGSIIAAMGYGDFTPTALNDFLTGKTVGLRTSMGSITTNVSGGSSIKDFETLLQVNYLKLTAPRKDDDLAMGAIATQKSQLTFLANNPQITFIDTVTQVLYNNDPRSPISIPTAQDLDKINIDRVLEIYKNEFGNAAGFHFFIVGNIDEATVKPLIEQYIASLPVDEAPSPAFKDNGLREIKGSHTLKFHKGAEPKSLILRQYYGEIPYSEDLALKADMLSDILNIKIIENLREEMSAIYGGGIHASVAKEPYNHYSLSMQFPCGPENVDTILKAADLQIRTIKENGPTTIDLDKVKAAKIEKHKEALQQNGYWTGKLSGILFWQQDRQRFFDFNKVVSSITEKDIQQTANQLFNGENEFTAIMYPEN